jgi:serine/threonine protein kinase
MHVLGSGGFADVFLYEQNMPRRQVAIKVLLSEVVNDQVRQMFQAEANLMAQLSAHPSILTVFQASVSADGRPYLVMELCSSAIGTTYRSEHLPVTEALRIGIRIGSAIETAHRAGVLHRDIKPSNILMTAYGHPVLSDFGIAATLGEMDGQDSVGMSIPWSAPEVLLDETAGTVQSEVWSLAATVYSLLAGRSPFEVPGGANSSADLVSRISKAKPQPTGRTDVPESLERLLAQTLTRKPANRPASVYELIAGFQTIETELGAQQTAIEVARDEWAMSTDSDIADRTRVRSIANVAEPRSGGRRRRSRASSAEGVGTAAGVSSGVRPSTITARKRALTWALAATVVVVLGLGASATWVLVRAGGSGIPQVSDVIATTTADSVDFSWGDPGLEPNDMYSITMGSGQTSLQRAEGFTVDANAGERVCITVAVNRDGVTGASSAQACADTPE